MRRSFILATCLFLSSCTKIVYVPYAVYPKIDIPKQPHYIVEDIKQSDDYSKVVKSWAASFQACQDYSKSMRIILEGYNNLDKGVQFNGGILR